MPERTYEDFLNMTVNNTQLLLTVRGTSTSGYRKPELVARVFSVHEINVPILESTEVQNKILKKDYCKKLADLKLQDFKQIPVVERIDDITTWPLVSLGNIFEYLLNLRIYNAKYVGKYKAIYLLREWVCWRDFDIPN